MDQRYAFVLRIWLTESPYTTGQKAGTLRGTLQSINATEPRHFNSLRQLSDLLEAAIQDDDIPAGASTESLD